MAGDRILSQLPALSSAGVSDVLPITDVATGITKKIAVSALVDNRLPVKAIGSEVVTGTNDTKFLTPKALSDSGLIAAIAKATGAEVNTGTDDTKFMTAKSFGDSNAALTTDIPVKAIGSEITTGTDDAKFATAKAIKDAGIVAASLLGGSAEPSSSNSSGSGYTEIGNGTDGRVTLITTVACKFHITASLVATGDSSSARTIGIQCYRDSTSIGAAVTLARSVGNTDTVPVHLTTSVVTASLAAGTYIFKVYGASTTGAIVTFSGARISVVAFPG